MTDSNSTAARSRSNRHPIRTRFAYVSPEEASGEKVAFSARREASCIYTKELGLTAAQNEAVTRLYTDEEICDNKYNPSSEDDQLAAASLLAEIALDEDSQEALGNRWSRKWSYESGKGGFTDRTKRVLYQCNCGYDHVEAGSKARHHAVPFTGCLVHAEVTYQVANEKVLRIRGYFTHNDECKMANLTRFPARALHPSVYKVALGQLKDGASLPDIRTRNRQLFVARGYEGQPTDLSTSSYRWLMESYDTRSLYRQFNRMMGMATRVAAQINVDEWLDENSPNFNPILADAVFHYKPRAERNERFEICIANKEMRDAAWKYAHHSQVLLDGTFGICNKKLLLFIVMGIDEKRRGVPLAFLLFSARADAKQASASYDTEIIQRLLAAWRKKLGQRNGEEFTVYVAITDTDIIERNALAEVFADIWLLICKFHLRQSWRNHQNRVLKGTSPLSMEMKARMKRVEENLIHTTSHSAALAIIAEEQEVLDAHKKELDQSGRAVINSAETHLTSYLRDWWCREGLWQSWSDFGRAVAATRMGCAVEGVLTTTNHLESFNGVLKRGHLRRWQRGHKRLRVDTLINVLVHQVMPSIFEQRALEKAEEARWESLMSSLPGGAVLVDRLKAKATDQKALPIAYLIADESRDSAARELLENGQIGAPTVNEQRLSLEFSCYSSLATAYDHSPVMYTLYVTFHGAASCNCPDFQARGGACKHLRAALLQLDVIRRQHPEIVIPAINFPASESEARRQEALHAISTGTITQEVLGVQAQAELASDPVARAAAAIDVILSETENTGGRPEAVGIEIDEESDSDALIPSDNADSDDDESVATDAPIEDNDFDFTVLRARTKAGVAVQSLARAFFELGTVAPKLGQLGRSLRGVELESSEDIGQMKAFKAEIDILNTELERMLLGRRTLFPAQGSASEPSNQTSSESSVTALPSTVRGIKRKPLQSSLLPPSPEKAQKRKPSYNIS